MHIYAVFVYSSLCVYVSSFELFLYCPLGKTGFLLRLSGFLPAFTAFIQQLPETRHVCRLLQQEEVMHSPAVRWSTVIAGGG